MVFGRHDQQVGVHDLEPIALDQHLLPINFCTLRPGEAITRDIRHHRHRHPLADQGQCRGEQRGTFPARCPERQP